TTKCFTWAAPDATKNVASRVVQTVRARAISAVINSAMKLFSIRNFRPINLKAGGNGSRQPRSTVLTLQGAKSRKYAVFVAGWVYELAPVVPGTSTQIAGDACGDFCSRSPAK